MKYHLGYLEPDAYSSNMLIPNYFSRLPNFLVFQGSFNISVYLVAMIFIF